MHKHHRHITLTGHIFGVSLFLCNKKTFDGWSTEVQAAVGEAAKAATEKQRQLAMAQDKFVLSQLDPNENEVVHLSDLERKEFVTAVQPVGRFGKFDIREGIIEKFQEKSSGDGNWVNGGFFVLEPDVIDYIENDNTSWEREPLEKLTKEQNISAYKHTGFYQPMDTLRDKIYLNELWESGHAPWNSWK